MERCNITAKQAHHAGWPLLLAMLFILLLCIWPQHSWADARCRIQASPINFGQYTERPSNSYGTLRLRCRQAGRANAKERIISYRIRLSPGYSNNYRNRSLREIGGNGKISYNIYTDSSRRLIWGDGTRGTHVVTGKMRVFRLRENRPEQIRMYARIDGRQSPMAGVYVDTIRVSIDF